MTAKIYTYTALTRLRESAFFEELTVLPHITATSDLAIAMRREYPEITRLVSMDEIQRSFLSEWQSTATVFQQYVKLGEILRGLALSERQSHVFESCIKNKRALLNTIRFLIAASVKPEDITACNEEMRFLKIIWNRFENETREFCSFRKEMEEMEANPHRFLSRIECEYPHFIGNCKSIVMHGFFYITPIQQRFIDMFEKAGIRIIYLCCMDRTLNKVQEIWDITLSPEWGFPRREERLSGYDEKQINHAFGELFDNDKVDIRKQYKNVKIIKYDSELDFIHDVKRLNKVGIQLFSADTDAAQDLLKAYYPESFRKRHLLSYPVGQFVYCLYSMWNEHSKQIELRYEDVRLCFSSGWVTAGLHNGKDSLVAFEKLKLYFERCRTTDEWRNAAICLKKARQMICGAFENHINRMPKRHLRDHRLMANPFLGLSCFSVSEKELEIVFKLINSLITTAEKLFSSDEGINIKAHFKELENILKSKTYKDYLYNEERAVVEELLNRLKNNRISIDTCYADDMASAMALIIGGGILDESGVAFEEEEENAFVRHITKIDSATLTMQKGIHLCLCDDTRMPGKTLALPWPLTNDILIGLEERIKGRRKLYVHEMRLMNIAAPAVKRYLFYSLLQNSNVEVSWIAKEEEKTIAPSPYIRILETVFDLLEINRSNNFKINLKGTVIYRKKPDRIKPGGSVNSQESIYDLMLCRWRFIYGYILSDHPDYKSDFHYGFFLSNLIGALSAASGENTKKIGTEIFKLLPYYTEVEKQQIIDFASDYKDVIGTDSLDDVSYHKRRLIPHFLRKENLVYAERLRDQYSVSEEASVYTLKDKIDNKEEICKYCSFHDNCPHVTRKER